VLCFIASGLKILQLADFVLVFLAHKISGIDERSNGFCYKKSRPLSITIIENNKIIALEIQGIL